MAVTLADLKVYLRIDEDITEDDALIESLGAAAVSYIEQTTGKAFNDKSGLMCLAEKMLVLHWYENRSTFTTRTNVNEIPDSIRMIITHIALAQAYAGIEEE